MMKIMMKISLWLMLVASIVLAQPDPKDSSVTFVAANPSAPSCSAGVSGSPGSTTIYYWPVANYPGGQAIVSTPLVVANAPNTLSGANFVIVSCNLPPYATTLDLLKSATPSMSVQGTCANCAIGTGSTTGQFNDQANTAPNPYTFNFNTAKYAVVRLNTRDYATARLEFSIGPDPVSGGGSFGPLPATSGGSGGLLSGGVVFGGVSGKLTQDNNNFAYSSTGPLGPYLSIGTTAQVNAQFLSFKGTPASHATETTILGDFNAAFDGTNSPFAIQGLSINSGTSGPANCPGGSCNPFVGHVIGMEGNAQETGNGLLTEIGVEGRADQITSTTAGQQHYTGVLGTAIKSFNGNNVQTMKSFEAILQSCNSTANTFATGGPNNDYPGGHLVCSSPDAHGTGIELHLTPIQGFLTKYGIWGDGDPWFNNGSSAVFTNAANVTVANVNAGFNLVPGVAGHTLKVNHFYIAARGGAAATCTDVRLGDSNNANAIVIDPVANLTLGTGNTEGTSTIAQSGFGATAFASGLGINIFKSGSSCATVTSFDTVVQYTIN